MIFSTSVAVTALCSVLCATPAKPEWQTDYRSALTLATASHKPLAVFITNGTDAVTQELSTDVKRILSSDYVTLLVDSKDATGKLLSEQFDLQHGVVISDRTGAKQAMRIEGTTNPVGFADLLNRLAIPDRVTQKTEVQSLGTAVPTVISVVESAPSSTIVSQPSPAPATHSSVVVTNPAPIMVAPAAYKPVAAPVFYPAAVAIPTATVCRT